jgi:hypothetical protein
MSDDDETSKQLLHLVFGGELKHGHSNEFVDPKKLHIVGIFPSYAEALRAWTSAARATIDDASMRYFIVHLHRLLQPETAEDRH